MKIIIKPEILQNKKLPDHGEFETRPISGQEFSDTSHGKSQRKIVGYRFKIQLIPPEFVSL